MSNILSVGFDGIVYASWLFLMASGLTLIYGVMRILNIAHGSLYALGGYSAGSPAGARARPRARGAPPRPPGAGGGRAGAASAAVGSFAMLLFAALLVGAVMGP